MYAQTDGTVSNLQLSPGLYATAATPLLALVSHQTDIVADFREKSLRHTWVDTDAAVVFDAMPGKVFSARVTSSDAGILAGQSWLTASCRNRNSPPAGCAMPSVCVFTSR